MSLSIFVRIIWYPNENISWSVNSACCLKCFSLLLAWITFINPFSEVWPFVSFHVSFHVHLVSFGCENCSQYKQLLPCDYNSAVNSFLPNNIVIRFKRENYLNLHTCEDFIILWFEKRLAVQRKLHIHIWRCPKQSLSSSESLVLTIASCLISCTASIKKEMLFCSHVLCKLTREWSSKLLGKTIIDRNIPFASTFKFLMRDREPFKIPLWSSTAVVDRSAIFMTLKS